MTTPTPITLQILDQRGQEGGRGIEDSLLVSFARPGRVEIAVQNDRLLIYVYEGDAVDLDQPPLFSFETDSTDLTTGATLSA